MFATILTGPVALAAQQGGTQAPPIVAPSAQPRSTAEPGQPVSVDAPDATREELTLMLEQTLRRATDPSLKAADRSRAQAEVAAIRHRLEAGDFKPGDRFLLTIIADSVRHQEMAVRDGPSIELGTLPPLSLAGILRSELQTAILQHLRRYFRAPEVRVQPLIRVAIAGAVSRPGTYSVLPDALASDVVMAAGGPLSTANPDKVVVTRAGREVIGSHRFGRAMKEGTTLERLGVRSGDEIRIAERGRRNWTQVVMITMFGVSAFSAILALIRSSYSN